MTEGTGVDRADPHQHPTEARPGTWWICLVAAGWIGWDVHDAADRMARTAAAGRTPIRLAPARTTMPEWMLLPGIGPAIATRLDRHRLEASEAIWRDETGWRLDRVRGVGRILQSDVAPDLAIGGGAGIERGGRR